MSDKNQPMPKPRKNPELMQSYLYWREVMLMRQRHELRRQAVERGVSNMDADIEASIISVFDPMLKDAKKSMVAWGKACGPVWDWLTSIKGLGEGGMAAQLLAMIDDIGNFATVSKLWRHAGYGMGDYWTVNGKQVAPVVGWQWKGDGDNREMVRVRPEQKPEWVLKSTRDVAIKDWVLPYNRKLKSLCYLVTEQFIKQQTPGYVDVYYEEKERQARLNPDLTKLHIHRRAMRKVSKILLQHLWVTWREMEGLPVSEPYAHAILLHTHCIEPEPVSA